MSDNLTAEQIAERYFPVCLIPDTILDENRGRRKRCIAAIAEATATLQARIKELDERHVRFMVEGGPVVMAADYERLQEHEASMLKQLETACESGAVEARRAERLQAELHCYVQCPSGHLCYSSAEGTVVCEACRLQDELSAFKSKGEYVCSKHKFTIPENVPCPYCSAEELQAEVAALKGMNTALNTHCDKWEKQYFEKTKEFLDRAETAERALAAERAQNEGLRRYLAHLELHRWCVICNEIRALLSAPAPAQQLADLSEPQRTALFGIPSKDDPFAKAVAPAQAPSHAPFCATKLGHACSCEEPSAEGKEQP